jgi:serine/threonine-protein kinase
MGEVYRARDTRLDREVAIKFSKDQFSERFEREARAVAALNHPNICQLYDVGPNYLVMELVEGEELSCPAPIETAVNYGRQIADAIEAAHEKGIVHRDLKPANIKVTPSGTVKVLDFGLAKALEQEIPQAQAQNSPTLSMTMTRAGMILGTAAYMSPEQAKGKSADRRADIWAFGVVLFEMLAGGQAFTGETAADTLASVLKEPVDFARLPVETPAAVRQLLERCLQRDVRKRLQAIGEARIILEGPLTAPEPPRPESSSAREPVVIAVKQPLSWRARLAMGLAALVLAVAAGVSVWFLKPSPASNIAKFLVPLGEGQRFTNAGRALLALSPDGTQMAYVANSRLYLRSMSELDARPIQGTDLGGSLLHPVFSPDGKSLAFFSGGDRTIKRIAVSGGAPVTICPFEGAPFGMSWGAEGILFTVRGKDIMRVSPNGGKPEPLVKLKPGEQAAQPEVLPGGEAILFSVLSGSGEGNPAGELWDKAQVVAENLKTGARKVVVEGGSDGHYLPTGHVVYALGGVLFVQPFDLRSLNTTGGPVGIVEGIQRGAIGNAQFAFSATGSLVYIPGPASSTATGQDSLALLDSKGVAELLAKVPPGTYDFPRVSPDGKRVAYQADEGKQSSIWTYDLSGASAPNHLTLTGNNRYPIWSPGVGGDGQRIAFQSDREGDLGIWWQRADGAGAAERLTKPEKGATHIPDSWSKDGNTFSFSVVTGANTESVWTYSVREKKATLFVEEPGARLYSSAFSPDGHWIAYQKLTSASGIVIYVKPFPPTATTYQISKEPTARNPLWSPDGKELFYNGNGATIFETVSIATQPQFAVGTPVIRAPGFRMHQDNVRPFDVLPNGKFVGAVVGQTETSTAIPPIHVVLNWFEEVKQRAPGK